MDYERQRSSNASAKSNLDRRSSSSLQKQLSSRDRSSRLDNDYDDTDSRGSGSRMTMGGNGRGSDRDRDQQQRDLDGDMRGSRDRSDQQDMDISSSHDTTPTSDESNRNRGQSQHHYYDDHHQDKTPPLQHQNDATPSPADGGPPTPTQNENNDSNVCSSNMVNSSVSSLVSSKPQQPALTPSLARFYKDALISHVTNWPAEAVERTCQRINEEHLNISNLGITKVSTELKMARSLVRLAEIQATLQEQRILFLRQQSHDLEAMRHKVAPHYVHHSSMNSNEPVVTMANSAAHLEQSIGMSAASSAAAAAHAVSSNA